MRRISPWIVATPSVGCGVTSSPFNGSSPPLEEKVARTVSNDLQRSIPPCACSTKFKSSVMGTLLYGRWLKVTSQEDDETALTTHWHSLMVQTSQCGSLRERCA